MSVTVNGLSAVSARLLVPWQGAWLADVDFDLDTTQIVPSGTVALVLGTRTLIGTIDPDFSGRFATHVRARIVAGGNGWQQIVDPQAFHNDAGVLSTATISATAALVGEKPVVAAPSSLGGDFVRTKGPAYQVLRGLDWHVDFQGLTQVSTRIPVPVTDDDVQILSFDGLMRTAQVATDVLLEPGMVLSDTRFASATIRQVEQTFTSAGARATVWLSTTDESTFSLGGALATIARTAVGLPSLRAYRYRVVSQAGDGRLVLQAVSKSAGIPDQLPIKVWYGAPGVSGKPTPGTIVVLRFVEEGGSLAPIPIVVAFDDTVPLEVDIAANLLASIKAAQITLGESAETGVATLGTMSVLLGDLETFVSAMGAFALAMSNALPDINSGLVTPQPPSPPAPTPGTIAQATTAATAASGAASPLAIQIPLPINFSTSVEAAP